MFLGGTFAWQVQEDSLKHSQSPGGLKNSLDTPDSGFSLSQGPDCGQLPPAWFTATAALPTLTHRKSGPGERLPWPEQREKSGMQSRERPREQPCLKNTNKRPEVTYPQLFQKRIVRGGRKCFRIFSWTRGGKHGGASAVRLGGPRGLGHPFLPPLSPRLGAQSVQCTAPRKPAGSRQ